MIKNNNINNKATIKYYYRSFAPLEDSLEVYYDLDRIINWNFVHTVANKAPIFRLTYELLDRTVRKLQQNDQK